MTAAVIQEDSSTLGRTVMLAGEVIVPGASEFVAGNIGSGVGSVLVAGAAAVLLGPTLPLVAALVGIGVRVNSYQRATTGRSLFTSIRGDVDRVIHRPKAEEHVEPTEPTEPVKSK